MFTAGNGNWNSINMMKVALHTLAQTSNIVKPVYNGMQIKFKPAFIGKFLWS
jgi:hypothetical protein